jgi:hypothetical protein
MTSSVSPSQIACTAATSSSAVNPLSSAVYPIPALVAWRLAYSLPLIQLGGVGKIGTELEEKRAEVGIDAIEVEVVDHCGGGHDPRVGRPRGGVVSSFGVEDSSFLLGPADEQHSLRALGSGQVLVHDVVLALTLAEVDHRETVIDGVATNAGDEVLAHRRHQRRGRDLETPMPGQEPDDLSDALQFRDVDVQIHPVEGLDLEHHMVRQDISSSTR